MSDGGDAYFRHHEWKVDNEDLLVFTQRIVDSLPRYAGSFRLDPASSLFVLAFVASMVLGDGFQGDPRDDAVLSFVRLLLCLNEVQDSMPRATVQRLSKEKLRTLNS